MVIRRLGAEDSGSVVDLENRVFGEDAWSETIVGAELTSQWSQYFGGFKDDALIGYVGFKGGVEGDLMTLAVHPSQRGGGVGKRLLLAALEAAGEAGMRRMFLEVRESNGAAQRLYTQVGFVPVGRVKSYYRNPVEDAVTMRKQPLG